MSQTTTLSQVMERVESMSGNHKDMNIRTRDISFDNLETVKIGSDAYPLKPIAQQSIANRLGIPIQYLKRCPEDIQAVNMNYWIRYEKNEELFFRFDGNKVRAVFTPRYIPIDNLEVLQKLDTLGYHGETRVQCDLDDEFMSLSIPDGKQTFNIYKERITPGIAVTNSEVGISALAVYLYMLRLVCTNGMISKTAVSTSYRHVSTRILSELPEVLSKISDELVLHKEQVKLSLKSRVDNPESTIHNINNQFMLNKAEKEAVDWAIPLEYGFSMFNIVNIYTKAAQHKGLSAESSFRLEKVGGAILVMVKHTVN